MHQKNIAASNRRLFLIIVFTITVFSLLPTCRCFAEKEQFGTITGTVKTKKGKYRKHAVAYIENVPDTFEPPEEHAVMDQKNMTFIPHVLPILKGTTVDFLNSDEVRHNIYSPDDVADNVNLGTWFKGEARSFTFDKLGVATMKCNVHSDMLAYIIVLQNPYYAKVNRRDGSFSIQNVPEGTYTLKLWTEPKGSFWGWGKSYEAEDITIEVKSGETTSVTFELE